MSEPSTGPSDAPLPSSFDDDLDFYEESRSNKIWRKLKEEPLIPLGCALTCYALYQAYFAMRRGDKVQTNRMFRARLYAQSFTLVAIVAGGIYYKEDRAKRKIYTDAMAEKQAQQKRDKWIMELEARDKEDSEWRDRHSAIEKAAKEASNAASTMTKSVKDVAGKVVDGVAKSMIEEQDTRGGVLEAVMELVQRNPWKR